MALAALITLPIGMLCYKGMANGYEEKFQGLIMRVRKMTSTVVEYIGGIEVIKAFNQSANSYQKYSDAVEDNAAYAVNWMKSVQLYKSMLVTIWPSVLVCVLPIGCVLYRNGSLSVPAFVTCIVLSLGIITPILNAMNFTDSISQMKSVVGELCAVLDEKELDRPETPVSIHSSNIVLENVSFSYESEKPLLKNINLSIPENSITAFVGPSGGGKSTITKLIAGFWDVTNGTVKLDGTDIRKIPLSQLMDNIAYISQDNYLFDETVLENIRMGKPSATDEEVYQAARDCGCYDFILNLENGFHTVVGGAGGHLSGGERQRIAIARAVLKNAPIVILDEATAYIDAENEALIQEAMAKVIAGKTVLMIAHRLSTITDADKIVVIKDGQIIDEGTHENLLTSCTLYQEMWKAHMDTKRCGVGGAKMIKTLSKIYQFSGKMQETMKKAILFSVLHSLFDMMSFGALAMVFSGLTDGFTTSMIWMIFGITLASMLLKIYCSYISDFGKVQIGYFMCAEKRIHIGDRMKYMPMGYFNDHNLGNLTSVVTTTMGDIENNASMVLTNILGGYIHAAIITIVMLCIDWRIGLTILCGILLFTWCIGRLQKKSETVSPQRQQAQEALVSNVLEYVQGMLIVKIL